ncbi:hypothetical protein CYMTET_17352 [Cymbomonas tetramitiformis]|uniref:Uncharacterized protein n=1 Tax=Cymbomonas tetramitiformis TaxID=36881 RepID=A0AAE0GAH2_9CHLO|nr:hypothetical protein CYMTET_17352 [Cymbomonas tetramitiformis]
MFNSLITTVPSILVACTAAPSVAYDAQVLREGMDQPFFSNRQAVRCLLVGLAYGFLCSLVARQIVQVDGEFITGDAQRDLVFGAMCLVDVVFAQAVCMSFRLKVYTWPWSTHISRQASSLGYINNPVGLMLIASDVLQQIANVG